MGDLELFLLPFAESFGMIDLALFDDFLWFFGFGGDALLVLLNWH